MAEINERDEYTDGLNAQISKLKEADLLRSNVLGRISIAAFDDKNNVTDEQCVRAVETMRETLKMIGKICRSNKHKDPVSDILCEINREKRLVSELA